MFKQNSETPKHQLQQAKTNARLPYHQPEVYSLGSIEQVQGLNQGTQYDGSGSNYYYS